MKTIKNQKDFVENICEYLKQNANNTGTYYYRVGNESEDTVIEYNEHLPISDVILTKLSNIGLPSFQDANQDIIRCNFKAPLKLLSQKSRIHFKKCEFEEEVICNGYQGVITFSNCKFHKGIKAEDAVFEEKVRFWECEFIENANFRNTTFSGLADFWRCTFTKKTIFYKTNFLETTVFSAVTFKENVLFTYALIGKLILFRGAKAIKGFDISLAILSGKLGLFGFYLKDYNSLEKPLSEDAYEDAVSIHADIPVINKRETFRILKDNLESQKNLAESLKFKAIEKNILSNELKHDTFSIANFLDRVNLFMNWSSNNHGTSYGRAFIFIIGFGLLFFYLSIISLDQFSFTLKPKEWAFDESFKYFMEFLNPIHKFDYLGQEIILSKRFYVLDFFGKTFVGYGIYQFIQAFRKYK